MFPLESPLAALLNLEVSSLGNHHCKETFEVMATPSLIFWASRGIDLCVCLDHWLPASLLTEHITTARDRRPQTAVSSVFYTVPVHITDVGSSFPRTLACSQGERLVRAVWVNLLCGGKWEGQRVETLLLTSKWMMSFTPHSWTLSMFHLLSFALSLTHSFLKTRWLPEIPSFFF